MSYRPDQRQTTCQIMTHAGWLTGMFHVPRKSKLVNYLNAQSDFLRVTSLSFMGKTNEVPFMSLQRNRIVLMVPAGGETDLSPDEDAPHERRVYVLLVGGVLSGTLKLRQNVRTSDYFSKQQGFILLEDCVLKFGRLSDPLLVEERHAAVVVNAAQVVGVSESDPLASSATNLESA